MSKSAAFGFGQRRNPTGTRQGDGTDAGVSWSDSYAADREALDASEALATVKSVLQMGEEKGEPGPPENESVQPTRVVRLRDELREDQVRKGSF